jgi:hypothetical protein
MAPVHSVNTSGIGVIEANVKTTIGPASVQAGDLVLVSGDLGRHGIAILSVREGLEFESPILSDTASVWPVVEALLNAGIEIHCLRDLTRGGLATTLNEIASDRNICIKLEETAIPVDEVVQGACEILGLDPLYVANEGRFAAIVTAAQAWQGGSGSGAHCGIAEPHRRQSRRRYALRRTVAENLLSAWQKSRRRPSYLQFATSNKRSGLSQIR